MNTSMINALVSMTGMQQKLDVIANNIANVNTGGYKRKEVSFENILTNVQQQPKSFRQPGRVTPLGFTQGWGARASQTTMNLEQGSLRVTSNPLDFAIEGDGFFEVGLAGVDENGEAALTAPAWTRNGTFELSMVPGDPGHSHIVTKEGHFVLGTNGAPLVVPNNHRLVIDGQGRIMAYPLDDPAAEPIAVGQMKVVRLLKPQLLENIGDNILSLPAGLNAAGNLNGIVQDMNLNEADADGGQSRIAIRQGFLESSNVNLTEEMGELIAVQRSFQLSSRALQSGDTMMNLANNLRG